MVMGTLTIVSSGEGMRTTSFLRCRLLFGSCAHLQKMRILLRTPRSYGRTRGGSCCDSLIFARLKFSQVVSPRTTSMIWNATSVKTAIARTPQSRQHTTAASPLRKLSGTLFSEPGSALGSWPPLMRLELAATNTHSKSIPLCHEVADEGAVIELTHAVA